jgi:hypothetical protein
MWNSTPWGTLWAIAMTIMVMSIAGWLLYGYSLKESLVLGLISGPGWLVCFTIVGGIGAIFRRESVP